MLQKIILTAAMLLALAMPCSARNLVYVDTMNTENPGFETPIYLDTDSIRWAEYDSVENHGFIFRVFTYPTSVARNSMLTQMVEMDDLFPTLFGKWTYSAHIYEIRIDTKPISMREITLEFYDSEDTLLKALRISNAQYAPVRSEIGNQVLHQVAEYIEKNLDYITTLPWYSYDEDAYHPMR